MYYSCISRVCSFGEIHGKVSQCNPKWEEVLKLDRMRLLDVKYHKSLNEGIAKIIINRPYRKNAFRPRTIQEIFACFTDARDDCSIGVTIFTGEGIEAFCSGGDQEFRNTGGYVGEDGVPRLNVLDLQVLLRRMPKPILAMVTGYAVGGGQILHMICDITIAAKNSIFGQTGPKVGSFDAGYGVSLLARLVGQKKAREIWYLTRMYSAIDAINMSLVNSIVVEQNIEIETLKWCKEIMQNSPMAIRILKSALNACEDGHMGLQQLGGDATLLFYHTEEGNEGKKSYLEKRSPDFSKFKRLP